MVLERHNKIVGSNNDIVRVHKSPNGLLIAQDMDHLQVVETPVSLTGSTNTLNSPKRMQLKLFVNESTFSERVRFYFIKNQTISLRIRLFFFILKLVTVVLYLVRAGLEDPLYTTCCGMCVRNISTLSAGTKTNPLWTSQYVFSWQPILWVHRPTGIWLTQVILAILSLLHKIVSTFANYKGNLSQQIFSVEWFLELCCTLPFIVTTFWSPLRCMFVPVFLNTWLAKAGLESMMNDLHRAAHKQQSAMFNQVCVLAATLMCLILTCICGFQQLERAGENRLDLFDAFWFVVVTFSTVGYGDITPTIWPSRLLVIIVIFVALGIIPTQVEKLSFLWSERQKQGGEYSRQRAKTEKHVVVCSTALRMDIILDFLNEFYAHPTLQKYYVVLLSPSALDGPLKNFLQVPIWAERVIYIQGSVLREVDLIRIKVDAAEACFVLTSRQEADRVAADEKTILRAMAVKDFAPSCPLYVHVLRPESKLHVQFADKIMCDDEVKHVLLAMHSYIPGISTLITLLAHTSKGQEGDNLKQEWKTHFGRSAGNEIYSVVAQESKFFGDYVGYKFANASVHAHSKCGATLFAVERAGEIRINPGNDFTIDSEDKLFYLCLTREEDAHIITDDSFVKNVSKVESVNETVGTAGNESLHYATEPMATSQEDIPRGINKLEETSTTMQRTKIDFPPVSPYVGHNTPVMCHVLEERARLCCMRLDRGCEHCRHTSALQYRWPNSHIIISAEFAAHSLFNALIPLRAHYRPAQSLYPVVLLLEHSPDNAFLHAISCFPMVYYMLGGLTGNLLDAVLHAGVTQAHSVTIIDRETSVCADEEYMADSRQLVATQTLFRLFPHIRMCLELTHASNMRFMHFEASDSTVDAHEFRKEREKEKSCSLPYLFREAFASGKVFSSSMLDTVLYQSFIKDYLPKLLRILLGIQYTSGSGHLDTHEVKEKETGKTYHEVFRTLCRREGLIVLGIYRFVERRQAQQYPARRDAFEDGKDDSDKEDELSVNFSPTRRRSGSLAFMKRSIRLRFGSTKRKNLQKLHQLHCLKSDRDQFNDMIQNRIKELELDSFVSPKHNSGEKAKENKFGYILLNPPSHTKLEKGDILYVIRPEMPTLGSRSESTASGATSEEALSGEISSSAQLSDVSTANHGEDNSNMLHPKVLDFSPAFAMIDEENDVSETENYQLRDVVTT